MSDAYVRYMQRVKRAQEVGFSTESIINELLREKSTITPRCVIKQATLSMEKTPHKRREAARAAAECMQAIDQIIKELTEKEITV